MYLEKAGYLLIYLIYVIKLNVMYETLNEFASTLENFVVFLHKKKGDSIKGLMAVEFFPLINCLVMKKYQHTAFKNSQVSPFCYKVGHHVFDIK